MGGRDSAAVGLLNRLAIRTFGVMVVSARSRQMDKDWFDRLLYFARLFGLLKNVQGDVAECGVAFGTSLAILAILVRSNGMSRHIWGFDSWLGLPAPSKEDLVTAESIAKKGVFASSSPEHVMATIRRYGFSDSEISEMLTLQKGLFSETLPDYGGRPLALLHIDADLYASYKDALEHLWPKITIDGIVALDEYQAWLAWPGARKAVDEFLTGLPPRTWRMEKDAYCNRYYVVKTA